MITELMGVATGVVHLLSAGLHPQVGDISVSGVVFGIFTTIRDWIESALYNLLLPTDFRNQLFGTLAGGGNLTTLGTAASTTAAGTQAIGLVQKTFTALAPVGITLAAVAGGVRMLTESLKGRSALTVGLAEVLPRVLFVAVLLVPIAGGVSIAYGFFEGVVNLTSGLGGVIFHAVMQWPGGSLNHLLGTNPMAELTPGNPGSSLAAGCAAPSTDGGSLCWGFGVWLASMAATNHGFLFIIMLVLIVLLLFYFLILLLMRAVLLVFAGILAPFALALVVFSPKNKFTNLWMDMALGALVIPLLLGLGMAVAFSLGLAMLPVDPATQQVNWNAMLSGSTLYGGAGEFAMATGAILFIAGIWLTGHMVTNLSWKHVKTHTLSTALGTATGIDIASHLRGAPGKVFQSGKSTSKSVSKAAHKRYLGGGKDEEEGADSKASGGAVKGGAVAAGSGAGVAAAGSAAAAGGSAAGGVAGGASNLEARVSSLEATARKTVAEQLGMKGEVNKTARKTAELAGKDFSNDGTGHYDDKGLSNWMMTEPAMEPVVAAMASHVMLTGNPKGDMGPPTWSASTASRISEVSSLAAANFRATSPPASPGPPPAPTVRTNIPDFQAAEPRSEEPAATSRRATPLDRSGRDA